MPENWGNKTIDNKTEWSKRDEFKGASKSLGVQDNRFHLGDDKGFTFGYDSDFMISYASVTDCLQISNENLNIPHFFKIDGTFVLAPLTDGPASVTSGGIVNIFSGYGNDASQTYQLHQARGTSEWIKLINAKDIVPSADWATNDGDILAIPTVKAVKDAITSAGVSTDISAAGDTTIAGPVDNEILIFSTVDNKWHNTNINSAEGDITVSNDTGTNIKLAVNNDAINLDKLSNASQTDIVLGRKSVGSGNYEEIDCTSFGRSLLSASSADAFMWKKYGGFTVAANYKDTNNTPGGTWVALRSTHSSNSPTVVSASFDPELGSHDISTYELARSIIFQAPKSGELEGVTISYCTDDNDVNHLMISVVRYNGDSETLGTGAQNDITEESVEMNINLSGLLDQNKYYNEFYTGLGKPFAAGDVFCVFIMVDAVTNPKPDMSLSLTLTGSYD